MMGSLCHALQYLAYARLMLGTSYALLAFGRLYRAIWLDEENTLYINLGPTHEPPDLVPMELHGLLLEGHRLGQDPTDLCCDLARPEDQQDFRRFLKYMGQQYINENMNLPLFWPHEEVTHPLGQSRIAVVRGFTVESLAEACARCRETMGDESLPRHSTEPRLEKTSGNGSSGKHDPGGDENASGEAAPKPGTMTSAGTLSTDYSNDEIQAPPPTSETDARLRSILSKKEDHTSQDLKDPREYNNYGLPSDVGDALREIARAAIDGGEDVTALLEMF